MSARIPLDVDLEDKLMYGLTPARLAYLVIALVAGLAAWSSHWAPPPVRGGTAAIVVCAGCIAAWGRWRGRATDDWAIDGAIFVLATRRVRCIGGWRSPEQMRREASLEVA